MGYQYAAFNINVIEKNIDFQLILRDSNYKDLILRIIKNNLNVPRKEDGGRSPKRVFSILVEDNNGNVIGRGKIF